MSCLHIFFHPGMEIQICTTTIHVCLSLRTDLEVLLLDVFVVMLGELL